MAKRRNNGEGSFYFDEAKQIYRAMIATPSGKRLTKSNKNEEVVKDWLNEQRLLIGRGQHIDPHGVTLGHWIDEWLDTYAKHSVRPRTYDSYVSLLAHTEPIRNKLLVKLMPVHIQKLYNSLSVLSGTTRKHLHYCLSGCLKQAVINKLIHSNPIESVEAPKAKRKNIEIFTDEEIKKLMEAAEGYKYPVIIHIAFGTGMRISEILALEWTDFDMKNNKVTIQRTVHYSMSAGTHTQETKTENSRRTIELFPDTMREIKKHQLKYGQDGKSGLLFPAIHGKHIPPTTYLRYYFKPIREKVGIEKGFHAFRHTHATQLIAAGVPIQEVSRRLGHSRVSTTLDIYTHAVETDEAKAMKAMGGIYKRIKAVKKA